MDNTLRKAAIELLKSAPEHITDHWPELDDVVKALAQPEQTPVAKVVAKISGVRAEIHPSLPVGTELYPAPPSKPWVSLTSEELASIVVEHAGFPTRQLAAIEAALRSKNNG